MQAEHTNKKKFWIEKRINLPEQQLHLCLLLFFFRSPNQLSLPGYVVYTKANEAHFFSLENFFFSPHAFNSVFCKFAVLLWFFFR